MKDFDTEIAAKHAERARDREARSFKLGGETFVYRDVVSYAIMEDVASTDEREGMDLIETMERSVLEMLEEGQEDRFREILRSKEKPLTFRDLNDICVWLTEAQVGRPTLAPSPSTGGDANTETSSTEDSSSPPAAVSVA